MMHIPHVRERFLILAREDGDQAMNLRRVLSGLGQVEVIVDRDDVQRSVPGTCGEGARWQAGIHPTDEEVEGYHGLMGRVDDFPKITSWSRALVHLSRTLREDEAVWFVEDDVAGDQESFEKLVTLTRRENADLSARSIKSREQMPDWYFWPKAMEWYDEPYCAYQPLCRLSARLIRELLVFREQHGYFIFHEILFVNLAMQHGMRILDWEQQPEHEACFAAFRYRPEVDDVACGVAHPVKCIERHTAICRLPRRKYPRLEDAHCEGWAIYKDDYRFLTNYCRKHGLSRIVEFGPGDSTRAFLDAGCQVVSYEHDLEWLQRTAGDFANEKDARILHCAEDHAPDDPGLLAEMVFVDGPPYREGQTHSRILPCMWALEECGHFLLHDAKRHGEQATLGMLISRGMKVIPIPTGKGLAIVIDPTRRPDLLRTLDSRHRVKYCGQKSGRWFTDDFQLWSVMFYERDLAQRVLEIGVTDGVSGNLLLDEVFPHPESVCFGIQSYRGEAGIELKQRYFWNARAGGNAARLHLREGESVVQLSALVHQGYGQDFDFIHHSGNARAAELLTELCLGWELLKDGGIMVIRRNKELEHGMQAFLSAYQSCYERLLSGACEVLIKQS